MPQSGDPEQESRFYRGRQLRGSQCEKSLRRHGRRNDPLLVFNVRTLSLTRVPNDVLNDLLCARTPRSENEKVAGTEESVGEA